MSNYRCLRGVLTSGDRGYYIWLMPPKRLFDTPEQFTALADLYFADCEANKKHITWNGLALAVGCSDRNSLDRYRRGEHGQGFVGPTKAAIGRVQAYYEERGGSIGIFALKNFGWTDKQTVDNISSDGSMTPSKKELTEEEVIEELKRRGLPLPQFDE